jgi:hypothetical protein
MTTSSLLRQAVHELEAALDAAALEYGTHSNEVQQISDAVVVMHDFMRHYQAARVRQPKEDTD